MSRKRKLHTKKKKSGVLTAVSGIVVATFLLVGVTGAIKVLGDFLTVEEEKAVEREESPHVAGAEEERDALLNAKFKIALMADPEDDLVHLQKALEKSKEMGVDYALFLGDHTGWGDLASLKKVRSFIDVAGIPYLAIPGDHDLAASVQGGDETGLANFTEVFGKNYHSLSLGDTKLVMLDNSANYSLISDELVEWFYAQLSDADIVILSQPLYHPTFNRTMGVVEGEEIPGVKEQADELLSRIRGSGVKAIIAADQHIFSTSTDPENSKLKHIAVGALNMERNLQTPRFTVIYLMEDGSYEIEEVVL